MPPHPVGVGGGFFGTLGGARHMRPDGTTGPSVPPGAGGNVTDAGGPGGTKGAGPATWRTEAPCLRRGVGAGRSRAEQCRAESSGSFWRWQRSHQRKKRRKSLPIFTLPCPCQGLLPRFSMLCDRLWGPRLSQYGACRRPISPCFIHLSKAE